jgi:glucose-6-phosphate dehydrogenase assembly protein OpcA
VEAAVKSGAVSEAVAKVEAQLHAFWSAANEGAEPKARASTMNFVALGTPSEREQLRTEIEDLAQTRAGRVFLLTLDGRLDPWDVEPDVSAVCHKEGEMIVCYDRIELAFGAMAASRAASVVSALALPEVPTIIETKPGAPSELVDPLLAAGDRIIVDSTELGVARIAEIAWLTKAPIADRAFIRAFSFRDLVADFFDDAVPAARAIRRVEIERTGPADGGLLGKRDPAALFFGWLASRLGWRFESATLAVDASGQGVRLLTHLVPPWGNLGPGEITRVRISTSLDGSPLELSCARKPEDPRSARWTREGALTGAHEHALGFHDESWVLRKAIDATEGDKIYRQAVELAADWSAR